MNMRDRANEAMDAPDQYKYRHDVESPFVVVVELCAVEVIQDVCGQ